LSIAGFILAWAISGLLVVIDMISGILAGTFFGIIGISLGFTDATTSQYIGFALHVLSGWLLEISLDNLHCFGIKSHNIIQDIE
jgi:hypothetical protein